MFVSYIFVLIAVFFGSAKGAISKKISVGISTLQDNLFVNGFRMLFCCIIGLGALAFSGGVQQLAVGWKEIAISVLSGVSFSAFVLVWMACVRHGALVMIDVSLTMGVIIPMLGEKLMWGTDISARQWLGFALLVVGILVLGSYNNSIKKKLSLTAILLLVCCGVANGFASLSQKMFIAFCPDTSTNVFNFYTYFSALILLGGMLMFKPKTVCEKIKDKKLMFVIFLVAVCPYLNLMFKMLAGVKLTPTQIYPLCHGLGIINSSVIGMVFFKEKINAKAIVGMAISIAALMLINL